MAKVQAVWGIDIGQCSLKALRCVTGENGEVIADAFDFVEYPKILSQPDVEPEELVKEALAQFLSRNDVKGDKVAVSVTGQAGLSRFFKPPPVDPKTLPDIVKYEAKQQIPFPLDDVIWDYQRIGGSEVDGLIVDAEVGLFAMKRDAVYRALQPFNEAGIEVDFIQLAPLAAFNFVIKDILSDVDIEEEIDPENPPESLVLLAIGTETTDLVVTNGVNVWMRNIPIGGNHFTKQLSRELKLTFTKAEHLKRNTRQAEDPKTLFQAMRPVFNDLVTEIQRSISYFRGINRHAKIGRMAMVGNAAKLPGLRQYLIKNLETEIVKFERFPTLEGDVVVNQKAFTENVLTFNVAYGLCLQGLGHARLETNLLPQEFITERLIRAKKPWALASLGAVMVGLTCSLLFSANGWWKVNPDRVVDGKSWKESFGAVDRVAKTSKSYIDQDEELTKQHGQFNALNAELIQSKDQFRLAPEIFSAVLQAFPEGPNSRKGEPFNPLTMDHSDRETIIIKDWEWVTVDNLGTWESTHAPKNGTNQFERTARGLEPFPDPDAEQDADANGNGPANGQGNPGNNKQAQGNQPKKANPQPGKSNKAAKKKTPLKGPGRVLVMNCYHDHNDLNKYKDAADRERGYVKKTLIRNLLFGKVKFNTQDPAGSVAVQADAGQAVANPADPKQVGAKQGAKQGNAKAPAGDPQNGIPSEESGELTTFAELGLKYPVLIGEQAREIEIENPYYARFLEEGKIPDKNISEWTAEEKRKYSQTWTVRRFEFTVEIAWQPTTYEERKEIREKAEAEKKKAAALQAKKNAAQANANKGNANKGANKGPMNKQGANQAKGGKQKAGPQGKGNAKQPNAKQPQGNGQKQGAQQKQPAGKGQAAPKNNNK